MRGLLVLLCLVCLSPPGGGGDRARAFSFTGEILPLLQRQGCSSAYCHGSATGRGGFKLSLFGSDAKADFLAITQDLGGRRLDLAKPDNSLLLKKPSKRMRHKGGKKLPAKGAAYARIRDWIASGAPWRRGEPAPLSGLTLEPVAGGFRVMARIGKEQRDVTALSMLSTSDELAAKIDAKGRVQRLQPGEVWIFARYGNTTARRAMDRPFAQVRFETNAVSPLDGAWLTRLAKLGLAPTATADAYTMVRRLHLDLVGRPPRPEEIEAFLALPADRRVAQTAERLLAEPDFARVFGDHLADWFEVGDPDTGNQPSRRLHARMRAHLRAAVQRGDSLETIARDLLTRTRDLIQRKNDPRDRAEFVGRAFLGLRIGCARCHDHPLDRWRREEHLAFSAFFADPRPNPEGGGMIAGKLFDPRSGRAITPRLLPVAVSASPDVPNQNERIARFVLDPAHGMFAENMANRVFAALLGRGLVEPLDDHRLSNPAVHESVLAVLASLEREHGYDLRALVKLIVTSRLYASDSKPGPDDALDRARAHFFARRTARPLSSQLLRDSVASVLGLPRPEQLRLPRSPLARQLALLNGPLLHDLLAAGGTQVDALAAFGGKPGARLQSLFLLILSRPPSDREREVFAPVLAADSKQSLRDLAFALLAGREFGSIR